MGSRPKVEEPLFRITDPAEVRARWEEAKAYYGENMPPWAKELPTEWPPRAPRPITVEASEATAPASEGELPPWHRDIDHGAIHDEPRPSVNFKKLKEARRKVQALGDVVRSEAFDDWLRRSVVIAQRPDEWSRARELYEGYLRHARKYGGNRGDKRLASEELATETRWGKMMGSLFPNKKRRRRGWYYPVRLKRGA